jgi:hypothetical protein
MYRKFNARNTASLVPSAAHILQIMLFELWSLTYTMYLQLHIFRTQYSAERICPDTGDMSTIQRALYCNLGANTAHILQNTLCELCLGHVQCNYSSTYSGFNIQQNLVPLLLDIRWQFSDHYTANLVPIQRKTFSLRNVNCDPGHIQFIYISAYSGFNI